MTSGVVNGWLDRSGYRRRIVAARFALPLGSLLVFLAFRLVHWARTPARKEMAGILMMVLFVAGFGLTLANPILLSLVQCRVCGLRLMGSSVARKMSGANRHRWLAILEACPVCGDDGSATLDSSGRWRASGLAPEEPYWSSTRILLAVFLTLLVVVVGGVVVGARMRP